MCCLHIDVDWFLAPCVFPIRPTRPTFSVVCTVLILTGASVISTSASHKCAFDFSVLSRDVASASHWISIWERTYESTLVIDHTSVRLMAATKSSRNRLTSSRTFWHTPSRSEHRSRNWHTMCNFDCSFGHFFCLCVPNNIAGVSSRCHESLNSILM